MKVCIIASAFPSSASDIRGKFVHEMAREIAKLGHELTVLAPYSSKSDDEYVLDGVKVKRFNYFFPKKMQQLCEGAGVPANINKSIIVKSQVMTLVLASIFKLLKEKGRFDIIHVHWPLPMAFAAILYKKLYSVPFVVSFHGAEIYLAKKYHLTKVLCYIVNESEGGGTNSEGTRRAALSCGIQNSKLKVLPTCIDADFFKPINVKKDSKHFRIISVGRFVERKGFIYLIEAISLLIKKYPNILVEIVGDGPDKSILDKRINDLGVKNHIKLISNISNQGLLHLYNKSDLFVLPSIIDSKGDTEGLGVVYLEAMACKTPVIGTNVGGIPDIITNNKNGLLIPQKDSKALSEAIEYMIKNPKKRKFFADKGYKTVHKRFNWPTVAKEYVSIYNKALGKNK